MEERVGARENNGKDIKHRRWKGDRKERIYDKEG